MTRSRRGGRVRVLAPAAVVLAMALMISACTASGPSPGVGSSSAGAVLPDSQLRKSVAAVPQRSLAPKQRMRLASGLVPPTNRWFSGLVFGKTPSPVFPFPLGFSATAGGFAAALPTASSSATSIGTSVENLLEVGLGATGFAVSAYDAVSATLEYRAGERILGRTTIAEGSPVVSYTAAGPGAVTLGGTIRTGSDPARGTVLVGGQTWAVVTSKAQIEGQRISVREGSTLSLFPVPAGTPDAGLATLMDAARSPLTRVATSYQKVTGGQQTILDYRTADGSPTLVVPLPHQRGAGARCTEGSYRTIYGTVRLCTASGLRFTTPDVAARASLDLGSVSAAQRAELRRSLAADVRALPAYADDTYYGGKTLYRAAMLLQLARQLKDPAAEKTLTASLTTALNRWMDPRGCDRRATQCFVYDPALKTIVGMAPSFGSELANDHQFHYGYFLYAAGVVAKDSPKLAESWAPVMNLLAADIASSNQGKGKLLPDRRTFDPYFSHSWASGLSEFASGNNQESSSEAVTAWAGLRLWAGAVGDRKLAAEADWMLSAESASALAYWVNPNLTGPQFQGFQGSMVSLNWGGKRDFATWFSAEPSAIIGIQLIPMSPSSGYLAARAGGGSARITALADQALAKGPGSPLADYALMYRALAGPAAAQDALAEARRMPPTAVDNGNSRTYLLAYIMSRTGAGS